MIFLVHVPKTGGASVGLSFLLDSIVPTTHIAGKEPDLSEKPFAFGHRRGVWARTHLGESPPRLITIVRDPVDLIVGQYWFWQNAAKVPNAGWHAHNDRIRKEMVLEEFVEILEDEKPWADAPVPEDWPIGRIPSVMSWLLEGVEDDLELIGVTNHLAVFHRHLGRLFGGVHPPLRLDHAGLRPGGIAARGTAYELPKLLAQRIHDLVPEDTACYERLVPRAVTS